MERYDLIVVGGGIAGSTLARRLAMQGLRVLVIEREERFRDRVRGEGILPWGITEAKALGIYRSVGGALRPCGALVEQLQRHQ
jgi:flavin-dependent dehydrogenase